MKQRRFIERIPGPLASVYEKAAKLVVESYYSQIAEEVVSSLQAGRILDLGTGPGYLPIEIVKRSPSIKVDGVDLSRRLIRLAQANALKAGVAHRVNFRVGNAAKLRLRGGPYDMVISTGMLHTLRDPVKVLGECYRVLKPGGQAWIYDPARVSSQIDRKQWKASLNFLERCMLKLFILFRLACPPPIYSRKEIEKMIGLTNFKEYSVEEEQDELQIKLTK